LREQVVHDAQQALAARGVAQVEPVELQRALRQEWHRRRASPRSRVHLGVADLHGRHGLEQAERRRVQELARAQAGRGGQQ
jgi:uncharacterized membrane protein